MLVKRSYQVQIMYNAYITCDGNARMVKIINNYYIYNR